MYDILHKQGEELKTYLNTLNDLPKGVYYEGDLVRSLSKKSMEGWGAVPEKMSESYFGSWGRYDLEGEDNVLYFSRNTIENQVELVPHYGQWTDYNTFVFENIKVENLLDLTDDTVIQKLGTDFDKLTKVLNSKEEMYEFTNVIAYWARQKGYNGIIAPGARGAKDYKNIILFEQSYIDIILKGKTSKKIKK